LNGGDKNWNKEKRNNFVWEAPYTGRKKTFLSGEKTNKAPKKCRAKGQEFTHGRGKVKKSRGSRGEIQRVKVTKEKIHRVIREIEVPVNSKKPR